MQSEWSPDVAYAVAGGLVLLLSVALVMSYIRRQRGLREAYSERALVRGYALGLAKRRIPGIHVSRLPAPTDTVPGHVNKPGLEKCTEGGGSFGESFAVVVGNQCMVVWPSDGDDDPTKG